MIADVRADVSGAREKIERVQKRLDDVSAVMNAPAAEMRAMAAASFASRSAPDGTPWPVPKDGDHSTGALASSVSITPSKKGLRIIVSSPHASYRMFGTKTSEAAPFLPFRLGKTGRIVRMTAGAAGEFWKRTRVRLRAFILDGQIA